MERTLDRTPVPLPGTLRQLFAVLEGAGYEVWVVGGAVRDHLLGRPVHDYDLTTDAPPEAIAALFPDAIGTGRQFLSMRVSVGEDRYELTTYRTEQSYGDHRHPGVVRPAAHIGEDLCRRDFTIGAICYHPLRGYYDPLGGMSDLRSGRVRAVGEAARRFEEDALRILRGIRLASELGFVIERATAAAMAAKAGLLPSLSGERMLCELDRILRGAHPGALDALLERGALAFLGIEGRGPLALLGTLPPDPIPRWAALFAGMPRPRAALARASAALRMPGALTGGVAASLDAMAGLEGERTDRNLKRMMGRYGPARVADGIRAGGACGRLSPVEAEDLSLRMQGILQRGEPYCRGMLAVNGRDLIRLGYRGKAVGETLDRLLARVIDCPAYNEYNKILADLMQDARMGLQNGR